MKLIDFTARKPTILYAERIHRERLAFIMPGVHVSVGAGSVVINDVLSSSAVIRKPARLIGLKKLYLRLKLKSRTNYKSHYVSYIYTTISFILLVGSLLNSIQARLYKSGIDSYYEKK